ncbi:tetratricopeptide repeat protein [Salibacteraceae bacterium]|jgi:tetratricopeptide (TPR) repeat protein|nr:tetratricopeptide repeat protein [Salibacteraceae bacterium]MDB4104272.1 tetratricopeptide repeat protein [Salibacteraceae bacterium]HAQ69879.1 tetratricopeptide repeat protein [Flavobacteriales bacterium]
MISQNKYYISGRTKFEAQDFEGALKDYSDAIGEEENPSIYSERAVVYFYLKNLEASMADMNYAATLEPENPYRYSSRAFIKDAMGDTEGAIADYEIAIKLDPEDSIAYNNLGLLQEKLGYKAKAKEYYDSADSLAEVDNLLERIKKKNFNEFVESVDAAAEEQKARKEMSLFVLMRNTLTTKSGFKEYIDFLKNGFKAR